MLCMYACKLSSLNKDKEDAFITSGFSNWKNPTESEKGFTQHESSKTHGDAVSRFLKFQVRLMILFKQNAVLLNYSKVKIEKI